MKLKNLFELPSELPAEELMETLVQKSGVRIERIVSAGQVSPENFWYDQAEDEWVAVLQGFAALEWGDGTRVELIPGDCLLIPAHKKHRVAYTSQEPPCVWLAVFA